MLEWDILNYLKKWRTNLRATGIALINTSDKIPKVIFSILWTGFPPWHTAPDAQLWCDWR